MQSPDRAPSSCLRPNPQVAGLLIAAGCLGLVQLTGNVVWDSVGSLAVAGLLGAVAVVLIQRNRRAQRSPRACALLLRVALLGCRALPATL